MLINKLNEPVRISNGEGHFFFGFHDLKISNSENTRLLCLQVEDINHPPSPGDKAKYGVIDINTKEFHCLGETNAWNYPQGARQQWLGDSNLFVVNNQVGDTWGAEIVDFQQSKVVKRLKYPVHIYDDATKYAYGMNYSRLHRMGGYGYIGVDDHTKSEPFPKDDGIVKHSTESGKATLLVSLYDIAHCSINSDSPTTKFHHIVTHLSLNPSGSRLAFLHRYRIPDGGEITRLMTIGCDGSDLRCLSTGFLSHFDWFDDESILIWGRNNASLDKIRANPILSSPIVKPFLIVAKRFAKKVISKNSSLVNSTFLKVTDHPEPQIIKFAPDSLIEDGHPMFNPKNRRWFVNDTYPNPDGVRTLMLFDINNYERIDLGVFKMINRSPDKSRINEQTSDLDSEVKKLFSEDLYAFTRSGIHCDLHPRWLSDGTSVAFDSIHEGSRHLYVLNVSEIISRNKHR